MPVWRWPTTASELVEVQAELAAANRDAPPMLFDGRGGVLLGGCFVAFARDDGGHGRPGDQGWAAAVVWTPPAGGGARRSDAWLRGVAQDGRPRPARDLVAHAVVAGRAGASYTPGLLALRDGEILGSAVDALPVRPHVMLVDATGLDHPRRAGLAVQLGAVSGLPTVGVTRRPFLARGDPPARRRGARAPVVLDGEVVGFWVCTRTGARPVLAHAAWRTAPDVAADVVLLASTEAARTPVPLQEARRIAREARALDETRHGHHAGGP